jgi:hypothetical protein
MTREATRFLSHPERSEGSRASSAYPRHHQYRLHKLLVMQNARAASRRSGACVDRIARMESRRIQTIQCATNAFSLTSSDAEDKNCERCNQPARSQPMVLIPAVLLRLPVCRKGFRRPFGNPVVDGHRTDERKHDAKTWIVKAIAAKRHADSFNCSKGSNSRRFSSAEPAIQNGITRPNSAANDARTLTCTSSGCRLNIGCANAATFNSLPHIRPSASIASR